MSLKDKVLRVHDVFSRRRKPAADQDFKPLGQKTRTKVLLLFRDIASDESGGYADPNAGLVWSEVHNLLEHLLGRPTLSQRMQAYGPLDYRTIPEDLSAFLAECSSEAFLDFLEMSFKVDHGPRASGGSAEVIEAINEILRIDRLPYYLTDYVKVEEEPAVGPFTGGKVIRRVAFPKIIVVDEEVVYEDAVAGCLDSPGCN